MRNAFKLLTVGLLVCVGVCLCAGAAEKQGGKALAKVNGQALYAADVYLKPELAKVSEDQRDKWLSDKLEAAIDKEVLYQAAKTDGLDKDAMYLETLKQINDMHAGMDAMIIANFYENTIEELKNTQDTSDVTDEDIEKWRKDHERIYRRHKGARLRELVLRDIAGNRHRQAYSKWMNEMVDKTPVSVNGKTIPAKLFKQAIEDTYGEGAAAAAMKANAKPKLNPLIAAVFDAAGVKAPKQDPDEQVPTVSDEVRDKFGEAVFKMGETEIKWIEMPQAADIFSIPLMDPFSGGMLLESLKPFIVAEVAKKAGIMDDPEFAGELASQLSAGSPVYEWIGVEGGRDKNVLVDTYLKNNGLGAGSLGSQKVTDEDIEAQMQKDAERFEKLNRTAYGKKHSRKIAERLAQADKARMAIKDFVKALREKAKIEIVK